MNSIQISMYNILGNSYCAQAEDGQKIFELIKKAFKEKKKVIVSFQNIDLITSAFLNTAIGQLYDGTFSEKDIKNSITVTDMENDDMLLLKRVIDTAKLYYKDPKKMDKSISEIMGD